MNNANMINGVITDHININDRAIHYGDGLFETILCEDKKLYYWQQHYQRLRDSAQKLDIRCPDEEILLNDISRLLKNETDTSHDSRTIKIILTRGTGYRGTGNRGYRYSKNITANRLVMSSKLDIEYSSLLSEKLLSGDLFLCDTQVSINTNLAGIKHLNRLENVLARNEWQETATDQTIDGVMLNANRHVIECTSSNIFGVRGGQLFTPDLQLSGVNGIMRDEVIKIAAEIDIVTSISNIGIDELLTMDELFITNSLIGLKSINTFKDRQYSNPEFTKLIYKKLMSAKDNHVQNL